jgi:pimeloyl-ACP methyl ester carboxylesterase
MGHRTGTAGRVHRAYAWVGDAQIHYRRSGPAGARSPLVILPAREEAGAALEEFMSETGRERTVIAPDLPGTGMSDPLRGPSGAAGEGAVLLDVVAELGLGIVDVLAIRGSGVTAIEMARQRPEVVRKIILVSAPAPAGLLSQPILALDLPDFPGAAGDAAAAVAAFLDG